MDYQERCRDLKARLRSTQEQNETMYSMIEHTKKMIQRARLERSLLLEKLDHISKNPNGDEQDNTPPQSPVADENGAAGTPINNGTEAAAGSAGTPVATAAKRTGGNKLPNAYTVFCDEERDNVIRSLEHKGVAIKTGVVQSNLSDRWKALSKEQKKPYSERARELKKRGAADQSEDTEDESLRDPKEEVKEETDEPTEPFEQPAAAPFYGSEPPSEAYAPVSDTE